MIKVVAYSKGKVIGQPWGAKARWEGPLPQRYTGTRSASGWTWDNPDAKSVRIGGDLQGHGGKTVEAWAGAGADRIVIYAAALDAVTDAKDAAADDHAPGRATDAEQAGSDVSSSSAQHSSAKHSQDAHAPRDPGPSAVGTPGGTGDLGASDDGGLGPSEADEKLADDFEREIGIGPPGEDGDDVQAPGPTNGTSQTQGRTGPDTRLGGTGPGGDRARLGGDGKGSEDGGRGGTEEGSRDGGKDGAPDGMYGGEGQLGDGGVPSAVALFGGLISLPPALRGLVEVALIARPALHRGRLPRLLALRQDAPNRAEVRPDQVHRESSSRLRGSQCQGRLQGHPRPLHMAPSRGWEDDDPRPGRPARCR